MENSKRIPNRNYAYVYTKYHFDVILEYQKLNDISQIIIFILILVFIFT